MHQVIERLCANVERVFIGNPKVVKLAVTSLVARGHLLLEDAPGLGKTLLARSLARSLSATFQRIQFTPDLLPSDITGVSVFDPATRSFSFVEGPVFTEILLADEINRTSPRTQAALLECMEEGQVTVEGHSRKLSDPFFVLATQNPVELAGTYPLPEAQLDRFLMRLELGYPGPEDEIRILEVHGNGSSPADLEVVTDLAGLRQIQAAADKLEVGPQMHQYIVAIAAASRNREGVALGVSPRGSLSLLRAAKAYAYVEGRTWLGPDDIKAVAPSVLGHRILLDAQGEVGGKRGSDLVREILDEVPVPILPHVEA
ncbi:MAG: MoxR family ATPase [Planctomycetota bacterium]